jgi:Uma2 family endonuclease
LAKATAEGHLTVSPDIAVEILSPSDRAYEISRKVSDYLAAGTRLVWVVNPESKIVEIHRSEGCGTILRESDILEGEDVLPGFRCPVAELFQPPPGVAT